LLGRLTLQKRIHVQSDRVVKEEGEFNETFHFARFFVFSLGFTEVLCLGFGVAHEVEADAFVVVLFDEDGHGMMRFAGAKPLNFGAVQASVGFGEVEQFLRR